MLTDFDELGLKGLLRRYPERVRDWTVGDPGVIKDIDTPDDYRRERRRWDGRD